MKSNSFDGLECTVLCIILELEMDGKTADMASQSASCALYGKPGIKRVHKADSEKIWETHRMFCERSALVTVSLLVQLQTPLQVQYAPEPI